MRQLSTDQVHAKTVAELGLDPNALDLTARESVAAALRRAAGNLCPCAAPTLIHAVLAPLDGLVPDLDALKESIEGTLEAMVAHGDLIEESEIGSIPEQRSGSLLYAAPPSYIARDSGLALLIGITPDQRSPLPEELEMRVEYVGHIRRIRAEANSDLREELSQLGLVELTFERWLKAPPSQGAALLIARMDSLLGAALPSVDIPGLTLLDPTRPVRYYRGRWVDARSQTGRFVGRRRQAHGADLWSYVQMRDGRPERFIDLPLTGSKVRGCDEAWRLQMAIDSQRGDPQLFRLRPARGNTRVIDLFSPVPMWARRRWDAVGEPVMATGSLFAYRFAENEMPEELRFLHEALWLSELNDGDSRQRE